MGVGMSAPEVFESVGITFNSFHWPVLFTSPIGFQFEGNFQCLHASNSVFHLEGGGALGFTPGKDLLKPSHNRGVRHA